MYRHDSPIKIGSRSTSINNNSNDTNKKKLSKFSYIYFYLWLIFLFFSVVEFYVENLCRYGRKSRENDDGTQEWQQLHLALQLESVQNFNNNTRKCKQKKNHLYITLTRIRCSFPLISSTLWLVFCAGLFSLNWILHETATKMYNDEKLIEWQWHNLMNVIKQCRTLLIFFLICNQQHIYDETM